MSFIPDYGINTQLIYMTVRLNTSVNKWHCYHDEDPQRLLNIKEKWIFY